MCDPDHSKAASLRTDTTAAAENAGLWGTTKRKLPGSCIDTAQLPPLVALSDTSMGEQFDENVAIL